MGGPNWVKATITGVGEIGGRSTNRKGKKNRDTIDKRFTSINYINISDITTNKSRTLGGRTLKFSLTNPDHTDLFILYPPFLFSVHITHLVLILYCLVI